ncbi:N-acetyldiaminopimelate deacetylase [Labeo rohita]|uniref:N-acetyldiaminopimelate deacetylase n=1 Tax=Labeo rohita TaxID=84645 RepID=A0ABQ8L866_LABRO|nr:N-acetyldiaminopimelate deacetylase [Labeo rohita]
MLVKVKLGDAQKFVKITELSLADFLTAAFLKFGVPSVPENVKVFDESGTEVDDDVFEDVVRDPSVGVLTIKHGADLGSASPQASHGQSNQSLSSSIDSSDSQDTVIIEESSSSKRMRLDDEAKKLVETILVQKPGGEHIINEYNRTKSLGDETRRKMVNILTADMTEKNGTSPPRQVKEKYARGIVALFPYLSDPFSKNGYEHYYDGESGTGYLAWRIKTIQRGLAKERRASFEGQGTSAEAGSGGPTIRRQSEFNPQTTLSEDECKEAIAFMSHSSDEDAIKKKMKLTFDYRRNMVLDPMQSSDTLTVFPRFKDIKGLIEQDFVLMFGEGVSGKLLEKWTTAFKKKVIQQCKKLPSTSDLEELLLAAESPTGDSEEGVNLGWDSDLSSIILLLHLIPPSAQGRKRPGKVSASQAEKHLVVFKKSGTNIEEHLREITSVAQPYLLAVGSQKNSIHQYFIILDRHAIPCKSTSSLGAIDELFKAHFVFGTSYNIMLHNMYTFIQTTVYNIDVGKVKESPRVAENFRMGNVVATFLKFGVPSVPKNVKVFDESGTEVDDDVFEDVVRDPSVGVLTIKHGAGFTWVLPLHKPLMGSQISPCLYISLSVIIEESSSSKRMSWWKPFLSRNLYITTKASERKICGIEHYYDGESGTGYLAWRIKTIQRGLAKERCATEAGSGGPNVRRQSEFNPETILSEDECKEAIAFMSHSSDEDAIKKEIKLTFDYRHNMIEQDFVLMFGEGVSGKLLEKWTTAFKKKVIQQCKKLPSTSDLEELLLAAESPTGDSEKGVNFGWDSDLSSIILLLHLIPLSAQGRKRPGKVSASQAETHLVVFKKPYLLAVGPQKNLIHQYFIVLDRHAIPCNSTSSLGAVDELFKAHFVFGTSYNIILHTTVYNIDVGKVKENLCVAEAELCGSKLLFRHFRLVHGFVPGKNLRLKCEEAGCCSVFGTFSRFRKHLNTKHPEQSDQHFDTIDNCETAEAEGQRSAQTFDQIGSVGEVATTSSTLDVCASAAAQLKFAGLSQSAVSGFVSSMEEMVFEIHSQAQDAALLCLSPHDIATKRKIGSSFQHLFKGRCLCCSPPFLTPHWITLIYVPSFMHRILDGDNLGLHSLLGFLESFGAQYCCRFCVLEKDRFQFVFSEDNPEVVLRTTEMHALHCKRLQENSTLPHVYGVKRYFAVDIMHDILEGVAQLEVKLVLQYIEHNFLSADDLAGRIHAFDYGYNQQRNRPPMVKLFGGSNDLGLNSIQSWCLLCNMPLLFGDLVQRDDKHWYLLLLLLQIVNIVFSPVLQKA